MKYNEKTLKGIYKRVVGSMSGLMDINVEIHPQVCPHWDPEQRTIRMPNVISFADNDEEDFIIGRGIVVHESGHVLFCPPFDSEGDQDLAEWFNVFLDCNNEYKVTELWPHLKKPLAYKTQVLVKKKPAILKSDNPFMQVIMRCDKLAELKPEFPSDYPEYLEDFVNEVVNDFESKEIYKATGNIVLEFTKEVNTKWKKLKDEKDPQGTLAQKARGDKIHKLMKELGDLIKSKGDQQAIKDVQEKIKEAGTLEKWFEQEIDKRMLNTAKGSPENFNDKSLEELKEMLKKVSEDAEVTLKGGWGVSDLSKCKDVITSAPWESEYANDFALDMTSAYQQGKKVNRALKKKVNLQSDFEKRHRSGTIDLDEIRRQVGHMGQIYKETVFKRDNDFTRGGQWAIEVLVDCSGSMCNGTKMVDAKQALGTLGYALDGLPNVKYALTGFTHNAQGPTDIQVKKFSDRRMDIKKLDLLHPTGGNADGYNVRSACKRLLKYKNMKKVLVVISDGQPAYEDGIDDTKKAVQLCEKFKINVVGIGIKGCVEQVLEEIYPKRYMFENTENLHQELTSLILGCLGNRSQAILVKNKWSKR
jgi:hypothetical protein